VAIEGMKVGELAERTGLSVRTLHHYDDIGLLPPAGRTPSGHRIYGLLQVRRLQQIASLRQLGLSLDEVRECLERPEYSLDRVLALQVERLRGEIERQRRLVRLLEALRRRLEGAEEISVDDVARTIEATTWHERYYTPEQRAKIARRAEELGEARIRKGQEDWAELFQAFGSAMQRGLDPADAEVRPLVERAQALIEEFTGGDPGIRRGLARLYREEGGENVMARQGMRPPEGLWAWYGRAMAAHGAWRKGEDP
jgi:DNA-binding transcriptional MerR regulator